MPFLQEGGKGLPTWHGPSTLMMHSRARDTDPPDPPSFPCRPLCPMLAFSLWQPQPQSPCSKARTLHPSMIHITTPAGMSYSSRPASPCSPPPPQSPCSRPYPEESRLLSGQEGQRRASRYQPLQQRSHTVLQHRQEERGCSGPPG